MALSWRFVISFLFMVVFMQSKGEMFTAVVELERLLYTEGEIVKTLEKYLETEENRLQKVRNIREEYGKLYKTASQNIQTFLANPVNAYLLVKRLTADWKAAENLLLSSEGKALIENITRFREDLKFPDDEDLTGAAAALLRLQDTYKLETSSLAKGHIKGVKPSPELTAGDCFELGRQSYNSGDHYHTILWMQESLDRVDEEVNKTADKAEILEYLAFSTYMQGNVRHALKLTADLLELVPDHPRARGNKAYYEDAIRKSEQQKRGDDGDVPVETYIATSEIPEAVEELSEREVYENWEEICSDIQTYCILDDGEPTCECDNDMEYSKDEGICIEICSKEQSEGLTWKEYCIKNNFGQCVVDQKIPTCSCNDDKYFESENCKEICSKEQSTGLTWKEYCIKNNFGQCIVHQKIPTCSCNDDKYFEIESENCKENTICEDGEKGFSECNDKNAVCNIIPSKKDGYECKCRKGFEMTVEERCIKIDYCAPKSEGDSICLEKNGRCEVDLNNEEGFVCICNGEKICDEEEQTESNENFFVNRTTTFINEYSTVSQDEISDNFSMEMNNTETTMPDLTINTSSEKSDFTVDNFTHLPEDILSETSSVTTEIFTNPSSFSSLTVNENDNFSVNEIRNSTETYFDGLNNVDPTKPSFEKSPVVFIVGIVLGAIFVVVMMIVVVLILRWKKGRKNENCNLKIVEDYERKLGSLAPTFFQNENIEILKVPEKPITPLSV